VEEEKPQIVVYDLKVVEDELKVFEEPLLEEENLQFEQSMSDFLEPQIMRSPDEKQYQTSFAGQHQVSCTLSELQNQAIQI
jgi:hypothetical protein